MLTRLNATVAPEERPLVGLLLLLSFALGVALVYTDVATRALFLARFPAEQLAYAYLASAAVIPLAGLAFGRLQRRVGYSRLSMGMVGFLLLSLVALWAGVVLGRLEWPVFVLIIWYRLYYAFNGLLFWGLAGQLFTLRQGKRLFGLVGTGESLAGVIGYFFASLIAGWLGTESMLLIAGAGLILSVAVLLRIERLGWAARAQEAGAGAAPAPQEGRAGLGRYPMLIIAVAVAAILCYLFADYGFSAESELAIQGADALAGFFGIFFGAVAVLRIIFRGVVSGWLLRRFGLRAGLLALPLAFAAGAAALLAIAPLGVAGALFGLMALTRFVASVLQPSIQRAALQVLYQPLPGRQRLAIQSQIESIIEPVAIGAGSLLLIGLDAVGALSTPVVAGAILLVGLAWLLVSLGLVGDYRDALGRALARRLLEGSALELSDASSRAVIGRALGSRHPGEVIYAMGLLERADPALLAVRLPGLLDHPDPRVRREAAARIGRSADLALRGTLLAAYEREADPDVRARMVQALDGGTDERSAALIARAHSDPAPQVRDAGLLHELRGAGADAGPAARLRAMLAAGPAERARAARIIGRLGAGAWAGELIGLFADEDAAVRREALRAAGRRSDGAILQALLDALARPGTRGPAAVSLARRGEAAIPAIADVIARPARLRQMGRPPGCCARPSTPGWPGCASACSPCLS